MARRLKTSAEIVLNKLWFSFIHNHFLVYNSSWEDPAIDRRLLQLDQNSEVLMITGAGDNTLDYLLDQPASIHSVDLNFRQNALLNYKRSLFDHDHQDILKEVFLKGRTEAFKHSDISTFDFLKQQERIYLKQFFSRYQKRSFYHRGTTGLMAKLLNQYIRQQDLDKLILPLFAFSDLQEQRDYYNTIENELWKGKTLKLIDNPLSSSLVGVPASQLDQSRNEQSLLTYLRECLKQVFSRTLAMYNYFWKVYLYGAYDDHIAPNYLLDEYFDVLSELVHRVQTYSRSLIYHLKNTDHSYSHFVLLDHMDWYSDTPSELGELWKLILKRAKPGAKVLFRTVHPSRSFLPEWVNATFCFEDELSNQLHHLDRVGTYRGTHLGVLKS